MSKGGGFDMVESASEGLGEWLNGRCLPRIHYLEKVQLLPRSTRERLYRDSAVEGAVRDSVITSLRIDSMMTPIFRAGHLSS